jgi:purine nucleoside phosphorylase
MLPQKLKHEEVVETSLRVRDEFARLVRAIVARIGRRGTHNDEDA